MKLIPKCWLYTSLIVLFFSAGISHITTLVTDLNTYTIVPNPSIQYMKHEVINIDGNDNFRAIATRENWQGDGSLSSPYVISGHNITSFSDSNLIDIRNTNLSFQILNCLLQGGNRGIFLTNVTNGQITNNTITRNEGRGIHLDSSDQNTITDNIINMTEFWGLELNNSRQNYISSNKFSKTLYGIKLHFSENNTLKGNKINETKLGDPFYGGLFLFQSSHNSLSSNNISDNPLNGVAVYSSSNCSLSGNFIYNNNGMGIYLEDSSNSSLTHNTIVNSHLDGLHLQNSQYNTLVGNSISNNHEQGISLHRSSSCTLYENNVSENQGDGITLHDSDSCTLFDNNVTNNDRGISDSSSRKIIISGNFLTQNKNYSIFLWGSVDAQIEWNNFVDNNLNGETSQAYDLVGENAFRYNYWNDWSGTGSYVIDGLILNIDFYPLTDYVPHHQLTEPTIVAPAKGKVVSKEVNIKWTAASDSRGTHKISYSVYYSTDGEEWTIIVSGLTPTHFSWNTTALDDGPNYRIKIIASCLFGVFSEANSEVFTVDNAYSPPIFPPALLVLLISGIIIAIGLFMWQGKKMLFQPKLEITSFVICLGSLTDDGLTIQEKSQDCPFDDQELLSMIEYSAVLYQHGEIGDIYGPFPQTSITRSTDAEWHYLSFAFHVRDESAEDTRVVKKGGETPAILLIFYEREFDAVISSKKDEIRDYLRSMDLEDISKVTRDWIAQIEEGLQKNVRTKEHRVS